MIATRGVAKKAITRWLASELGAIHGPEIPDIEPSTVATNQARAQFCESIIGALNLLIDGSSDDEDAILWAAASIARLHGARIAESHGCFCPVCVAESIALVGGQIGNAVLLHCDAGALSLNSRH
jgi:hypothetical protein